MPPRSQRHRADPGISARALSAMADAARRARGADGGGQDPRTAMRRQQPDPRGADEGDPNSHVTESLRPQPAPPPVVAAAVVAPPPPPPATSSPPSAPSFPVLIFDALAEEQAGAGSGPTSPGPPRPGSPIDGPTAASPAVRHRPSAQRSPDAYRWLRRAVAVVSAALVVVLAALVGSVLTGGGAPTTTSSLHGSSVLAKQPSSTVPVTSPTTTTSVPATVPAPPPTSGTATTVPSPTQPAPSVGPPVLASLQPSSGTAGQSVVATGSGFLSPSGAISATVGGQTASVTCPDQTTCTLTIPPQTGTATSVPVVIVTDGGSSDPLTFVVS